MTQLSDFPPDVRQLASQAWVRLGRSREDDEQAISAAIMADRAGRAPLRVVGLTAHQKRVMDYLTWFIGKNGISPSFDDIRAHLGLASKSSVHRVIHELEERGAIQRLPNRARSITIIANPN